MQDLEGLLDRLITVATRSGGSSRDSGSLNALQVAVKLDGPVTYLQWERSTRLLVQGRGLEGYLTGTKRKPANNEQDMAQWRMENSAVLVFLLNTMTPNVARSVQLLETAQEVWETVAQMFSQKQNSAQAFEIRSQLRHLRQGDLSITEYATELKRLWSEADHYRTFIPQCSIDVDRFQKYLEEERVQDFLYGLNSEYESVRVQLLARDILPNLGQVFSTVLSEETRRRVTSDSNSSVRSALTVQPQQVGEKVCFHCKKPGHTKAFCWDLHGRPNQPGRSSRGRGSRSGGRTGGQNHVRGSVQANLSEETESAVHSLSTEEYQTFRRMMEKYESSSNTTPTLEQSSHQDGYLDSSLFAHSGKGSIDCTPSLRLSSVLHELKMGKILGGGRLHNGLYYLSTDEKNMNSSLTGYALSVEGTQFGVKIKILRSDNGTEYINQEFRAYLHTHEIIHQTTCIDTPAQNGVAERKNQHLLEGTRSIVPPARYRYDIANYVSYKNVSPSYQSFVAVLDSVCIPSTWQKAMAEPKWKEAMLEEMTALSKNQTWDLVTLPAGKHPLDVKNAFLHGDLQEEVYMQIPPGFETRATIEKVCKLKRSLYGLKQSPRTWFDRFSQTVKGMGYKQSNTDNTLFYRHLKGKKTILLVYVDDIVITGDDHHEIKQLKEKLKQVFEKLLKELQLLNKFFLRLYCDNKAAIEIVSNPIQHDRTKHIEIDRHFIKEKINQGQICITYIRSSDQVADILTKGLSSVSFSGLIDKMGLRDIFASS
ncbi:uncharacterized protein [Elaeis guineensis]|uniref:uncharacterized protein n=1 Tax=Elaeis guineensis var. tenera TaxID=51953 RepID=UPI003C6D7FC8